MDSGNSGSMQSSSCGDEEFDSRSESISSFFTSSSSSSHVIGALGSSLNQPPPQPQPPPLLFDPLSSYLDVFARPPSSSMVWPIGLRSEPNCTQPAGPFPPAPSPTPQGLSTRTPPFLIPSSSASSSMLSDHHHQINTTTRVAASSASTSTTDPANIAVGRNPKKRSRASRRAPTTVLTTDTTNFRAMVQEFTGIPAPPFTASSPFARSRLDLFGTTASSTTRSGSLDPTTASSPSYLLRPFAHKFQAPPPPPSFMSPNTSTPLSDHTNVIASPTTNTTTTTTITNTSKTNPTVTAVNPNSNSGSNSNYQQLPPELGLLPYKQQQQQPIQNLLSMQDHHHHHHHPMLSFQSLLQSSSSLKNPSSSSSSMLSQNNVPIFGMKSSSTSSSSAQVNLTMNPQVHDELGAGELVVTGGLPSLVSSSGHGFISLRSNDNNWVSNSSCKMNFSASSSDFLADNKGAENVNVPSRGEGIVDSWICPSD